MRASKTNAVKERYVCVYIWFHTILFSNVEFLVHFLHQHQRPCLGNGIDFCDLVFHNLHQVLSLSSAVCILYVDMLLFCKYLDLFGLKKQTGKPNKAPMKDADGMTC